MGLKELSDPSPPPFRFRRCSIALYLLLTVLLHCIEESQSVRNPALPRHSNFLRSTYRSVSGRQQYVSCAHNATVCLDLHRNPSGQGSTCCWNIYCKDTTQDPYNCGDCGHTCGYGMTCCNGSCVNLNSDSRNCGGCSNSCPGEDQCSFAMCEYAGGGNHKYVELVKGPKH